MKIDVNKSLECVGSEKVVSSISIEDLEELVALRAMNNGREIKIPICFT